MDGAKQLPIVGRFKVLKEKLMKNKNKKWFKQLSIIWLKGQDKRLLNFKNIWNLMIRHKKLK